MEIQNSKNHTVKRDLTTEILETDDEIFSWAVDVIRDFAARRSISVPIIGTDTTYEEKILTASFPGEKQPRLKIPFSNFKNISRHDAALMIKEHLYKV